jgi:hypothetical protein
MKSSIIKLAGMFLAGMLVMIMSCAEENPDLVNPPSQAETVTIRLFNLADDFQERQLQIDTRSTNSTLHSRVSDAITPPLDSGIVSLLKSGNPEIKINQKMKFARNAAYTFISLPSPYGSPNYRPVDTVFYVQTVTSTDETSLDGVVKFFNAYPDSTRAYSLRYGCPNGALLAVPQAYKYQSVPIYLRYGEQAVSIVRHTYQGESLLGVYSINITALGQYVLIVHDDGSGQEKVSFINQFEKSSNAISSPTTLTDRVAYLRMMNFSASNVMVIKNPSEVIETDLSQNYVSSFKEMSACVNEYKDVITVTDPGGNTIYTQDSISFGVLNKYTIGIFDSASKPAAKMIFALPVFMAPVKSGYSRIRVMNGLYKYDAVSLTLGSRENTTSSKGYSSGEILARNLRYGEVSEPVDLISGNLPIYTVTDIGYPLMLSTSIGRVESGKSYILVVRLDANQKTLLSLVEDETSNFNAVNTVEGVSIQVTHAFPGLDQATISLPGVINSASQYYASTIATVVPEGNYIMNFNGISEEIVSAIGDRINIIAYSDNDVLALFKHMAPPMGADESNFRRRFLNLSRDVKYLDVRDDIKDTVRWPIVRGLEFGYFSDNLSETLERRISLFFIDQPTFYILERMDDINQPRGSNYSFIFTSRKGFDTTVIQQQEY